MRQCKACPWKVGADTRDIPGYSKAQHRALKDTIAQPGSLAGLGGGLRVMACHDSTEDAPRECVGWVHNQLNGGNNLGLRLLALDGRFAAMRVEGPQHPTLAATLRRGRRAAKGTL